MAKALVNSAGKVLLRNGKVATTDSAACCCATAPTGCNFALLCNPAQVSLGKRGFYTDYDPGPALAVYKTLATEVHFNIAGDCTLDMSWTDDATVGTPYLLSGEIYTVGPNSSPLMGSPFVNSIVTVLTGAGTGTPGCYLVYNTDTHVGEWFSDADDSLLGETPCCLYGECTEDPSVSDTLEDGHFIRNCTRTGDDPENPDSPSTASWETTLTNIFATDELIGYAETALPDLYSGWTTGSCTATRNLAESETTISLSRFQYKWTFDAATVSRTLHWTDENGSTTSELIPAGATESTVHQVNEPAVNGPELSIDFKTAYFDDSTGACCSYGFCTDGTFAECAAIGGEFQGVCSSCAFPCPEHLSSVSFSITSTGIFLPDDCSISPVSSNTIVAVTADTTLATSAVVTIDNTISLPDVKKYECIPHRVDEPPLAQAAGSITFTLIRGGPGANTLTVDWSLECDCGIFTGTVTRDNLQDNDSFTDFFSSFTPIFWSYTTAVDVTF